MDEQDEIQILSDANIQQTLVYDVKGKKALTYVGIKFLFQKYIHHENITVVILHDQTYCNLEKDDPENKTMWFWRATYTIQTTKILQNGEKQIIQVQGQSECNYTEPFARIKAHSKSERNAQRKVLPEFQITHMINEINPKDVQKLQGTKTPENNTPTTPSEKQLEYLTNLGYTGPKPKTSFEAGKLIEELKNGAQTQN